MVKMNEEIFKKELKLLNIDYRPEIQGKIELFYEILVEENSKYNLTAIKNKEDVYLKHIYDSLTLIKVIDLNQNLKLLDIGSGAGFPGIILKIFFPNLEITLLDSNNKKTYFLNLVKEKLNLTNLEIVNNRAEEYIKNKKEYYDVVVARAVSALNVLIELSIPYLKVNGKFIAMKAKENEEEIKLGKETATVLNSEIKIIEKFYLPIEKSERTLIEINKVKPTSDKFPRRYDQILKYPLKKN